MGPTLMILAIGQHGRVDKQVIDRPDQVDSETMRTIDRRLQALRGLTYPEAQARVLQLAAEGRETERDLLLHIAETLRIATQGEGSAHMVIGGVSTDVCIAATAIDAHMRELAVHVPSDCVAAPSRARSERALKLLRDSIGAATAAARWVRP